jgi:7,8-dihydropterin-6-yl-methyl-4-(beta-D-ribofuranosyl)aminobenzene 5'-phosphate synthase
MKEFEKLTVNVLVDNTADMLSSGPVHIKSELRVLMDAGMKEMAGQSLCLAQHGISLAVTAHFENEEHSVLFDAGPDPATLERNSKFIGFDFGTVEAVVLSHGHFDHSEGLIKAADMIREQIGRKSIPLHVHPGAFVKRADVLADGEILPLQVVPSTEDLEAAGFEVIKSEKQEEILSGTFYLSGEIPRRSFEKGLENQVRQSDAGEWEPDPLVMEERFMAAHVKNKGLVIFTGCSHAGVINICTHARERFPDIPLYALIGGFHLVYPNEELIEDTINVFKQFGLKMIIPGHCTGWRAVHALLNAFGEKAVNPLAVGSRISL